MKKIVAIVTCLVAIAIALYAMYDFLVVELDELSAGEFLAEYPSPNNAYRAKAYLLDEGGATVRAAIRVAIDDGNKAKTIYWNYDESTAHIHWLDTETIEINGHQLNIFKDTYHWKKDADWESNRGKY
ncbi:DUF5412 family protein [Lysinibacillus sp. NPDC097195]|uniref:DUF5412 family protein n=1 Tax=Lysinibacillus sp. NPDC097195 TaxID=3364141 RepID=UPI0037F8D48F